MKCKIPGGFIANNKTLFMEKYVSCTALKGKLLSESFQKFKILLREHREIISHKYRNCIEEKIEYTIFEVTNSQTENRRRKENGSLKSD